MKIAYLIIAHAQPNHLARLINHLKSPQAYFFIHVDAKVKIDSFQKATGLNKQIVYLKSKQRVPVYWGAFSIVQATLNLMQISYDYPQEFFRYTLLSGLDYPIKTRSEIESTLLGSDKEYINIHEKIRPDTACYKYISQYWFYDNYWLNLRATPMRRASLLIHYVIGLLFRKRIFSNVQYYKGSAWWALTNQSMGFLLQFVKENPYFVRSYKFNLFPDEVFFHTILKLSPRADKISSSVGSNLPLGCQSGDCGIHYVDWHNPNPKWPRTFVESDLVTLQKSTSLFARKIEEKKSEKLLEKLDSWLATEKKQ